MSCLLIDDIAGLTNHFGVFETAVSVRECFRGRRHGPFTKRVHAQGYSMVRLFRCACFEGFRNKIPQRRQITAPELANHGRQIGCADASGLVLGRPSGTQVFRWKRGPRVRTRRHFPACLWRSQGCCYPEASKREHIPRHRVHGSAAHLVHHVHTAHLVHLCPCRVRVRPWRSTRRPCSVPSPALHSPYGPTGKWLCPAPHTRCPRGRPVDKKDPAMRGCPVYLQRVQ